MARNGSQIRRLNDFLSQVYLPMCRRVGIGPVGFFTNVIGPDSPSIVTVAGYPSLAQIEALHQKQEADEEFRKQAAAFGAAPATDPPYIRKESWLLRGIRSVPRIDPPPTESGRPPRLFELRIYESHNLRANRYALVKIDHIVIEHPDAS